jgi:hypothetical protein
MNPNDTAKCTGNGDDACDSPRPKGMAHAYRQRLHHYLSELDFRYNARKLKEEIRSLLAITRNGKRRMLRDSRAAGIKDN